VLLVLLVLVLVLLPPPPPPLPVLLPFRARFFLLEIFGAATAAALALEAPKASRNSEKDLL
jgi:hypothetical protein